MIEIKLNTGDVITSRQKAHYTCFGLGSCIGLFIHDRLTNLSGGAHILLPEDEVGPIDSTKFYNVASAIREILFQLKNNGSTLTSLRAKITGGANVINVNMRTGSRNAASVVKHLSAHKIFIAAIDVGGTYSRTARFESESGLLTVSMPKIKEFKIY